MSTYKEIRGTNIQVLASDPDNPVVGQVWYNSTDNELKGLSQTTAGAWSTGTSVNTARRGFGSNGTYTSSIICGGYSSTWLANTETWNGTSWTEVADLNTQRNGNTNAGADNTSALTTGGYDGTAYTGVTETWDGSTWTEVADLNTARSAPGGTGTQTAAIVTGGNLPANLSDVKTESWNGSSWTEVGDLNTAREGLNSSNTGIQTAALLVGGQQGNPAPNFTSALVESWNGTSWTEVGDLNSAREHIGNTGTQTDALAFGGASDTAPTALTESWNGTSWTEVADLSTARTQFGKSGNTSNSLAIAGYTGTADTAATEEWTGAGAPNPVTFTDS